MWVSVFLLSVLVNIKDRRKIVVIAGTFVIVSGLAYFAFMAAWLNLFLLIGIARPVQIVLGCFAVFIGVINVKDFSAFKKGISLSIPESAKPGLYRRVRDIVNAKYLSVALAGAVSLAIVVATLSHRRLQEAEGRWLKLISGLVIFALGAVMIFRPSWLEMS